jgi:hypothetical protein
VRRTCTFVAIQHVAARLRPQRWRDPEASCAAPNTVEFFISTSILSPQLQRRWAAPKTPSHVSPVVLAPLGTAFVHSRTKSYVAPPYRPRPLNSGRRVIRVNAILLLWKGKPEPLLVRRATTMASEQGSRPEPRPVTKLLVQPLSEAVRRESSPPPRNGTRRAMFDEARMGASVLRECPRDWLSVHGEFDILHFPQHHTCTENTCKTDPGTAHRTVAFC